MYNEIDCIFSPDELHCNIKEPEKWTNLELDHFSYLEFFFALILFITVIAMLIGIMFGTFFASLVYFHYSDSSSSWIPDWISNLGKSCSLSLVDESA